jgi:hypothetical protein
LKRQQKNARHNQITRELRHITTVCLSCPLFDRLARHAAGTKLSLSSIARMAIEEYLNQRESNGDNVTLAVG